MLSFFIQCMLLPHETQLEQNKVEKLD